jgi:predicted ATPase
MILWHLGYPDQAKKMAEEAITHARKWPHPFSLGFALCVGGTTIAQHCHDLHNGEELAKEAISLSESEMFPLWLGIATVLYGWFLVTMGQDDGITQIHKGLEELQSIGAKLLHTYHLALIGEAYGIVGNFDDGIEALDKALATVEESDIRFYESELHRLKGELLFMQGKEESEIEAYFQRAIDVARRQSARSLELRATMSLFRLWQKQGKKQEACTILSDIYDWSTEGFETQDLKEARALLER